MAEKKSNTTQSHMHTQSERLQILQLFCSLSVLDPRVGHTVDAPGSGSTVGPGPQAHPNCG